MKGIFYTAITVIFIIPMIFFASVYISSVKSESKDATSKAFGDKIISFSKSVNNDLPRAVDIIAKRSIESNIHYIEVNGIPVDNAESRIAESMLNGTVFGNTSMLDNFTLSSWSNELGVKGSNYGFSTTINIISLNVTPFDSYHVSIGVIISVNLTDPKSESNLYRIYNTKLPVSIEDQVDPLYLLNTNGLFKRKVIRPNITVSGIENVDKSIAERFYMQSENGPSFLDRMEGRFTIDPSYAGTANIIGLETFAYLPDLQANSIEIKLNQSCADYLYFDSASHGGDAVAGSDYGWLRLDQEHADTYGVTLI